MVNSKKSDKNYPDNQGAIKHFFILEVIIIEMFAFEILFPILL